MGRIKSLQQPMMNEMIGLNSLFSYRKLVADNNVVENNNNNNNKNSVQLVQNLIRMKLSQDYIAYCCGQCGHHQRFDLKADELHSLVGDALKSMATTTTTTSQPSTTNKTSSWTRQLHDKSRQCAPENNLTKETNKCKDTISKPLIKCGSSVALPIHQHPALLRGYKPLLTAKPQNNASCHGCSHHSSSSSSASSTASSESGYLPTLPVRTDSLTINAEEEALLKCAPWFQAGINREISLEILQQEPVGSFLVRSSTSKPGCYALSVRVPTKDGGTSIAHYLITQSNRGFKIKGFTKDFPSLTSLIIHHSVMPELLPCPLLLHRPSTGLLADLYQEHANNFVDIDSSILLELTSKSAE